MPRVPRPALLAAHALGTIVVSAALGLAPAAASAKTSKHTGRVTVAKRKRAAASTPGADTPTVSESLRQRVGAEYLQLTREVVQTYISSGSPERYYSAGLWQTGDPTCWYCNVGAAAGAAYLAETEPSMQSVAVDSLNRAIAENRLPNGSFQGGSPAISSAAFAIVLGMAYVRLAPTLASSTLAHWRESLAGIANFLISDHDVTWYANGNINASYAGALYFAWRATGQQTYLEAYNAQLEFLEHPTGHLWEGFGLVITEAPTLADGSNGRGFLTEGSPPGWDPEYSHLQLDWLSALYSASDDPRVLRLLNLILNQELTRVNTSTFVLDALGGSRKNEMMNFTSAALPLLVIDGERPDLTSLLPAAFARLQSEYAESFRHTDHNDYRGVALWLAPILLVTSSERPVVPASSTTQSAAGATSMAAPSSNLAPGQSPRSSGPVDDAATQIPSISPRALEASHLIAVPPLEVPALEYTFAVPAALTRGVVATASDQRPAFAALACTRACTISVRPLLVIHRSGEQTPVIVQTNLQASRASLRAGQVFVSRVLVPRSALRAARHGHAVFVRLRLTVLTPGSALQGRSAFFRVAP